MVFIGGVKLWGKRLTSLVFSIAFFLALYLCVRETERDGTGERSG
jgi:branched-subunit amino acid ABC-type transport system permease component